VDGLFLGRRNSSRRASPSSRCVTNYPVHIVEGRFSYLGAKLLTKTLLRDLLLGTNEPPERDKKDPALFDCFAKTPTPRLLDSGHTPERHYTPSPKRFVPSLKQFVDLRTGETVWRKRGGKNFRRIIPPWIPEGLLRIRGRLLRAHHEWVDYPQGWSADCSEHLPYEIRRVVDLALHGTDFSGCNEPGLADYAAHVIRVRDCWRSDDVRLPWSSGPSIAAGPTDNRDLQELVANLDKGLLPQARGRWTATEVRGILNLELKLAKAKRRAGKSRVVTTEFRDERTGEYGRQVSVWNGRVIIGKNNKPALTGAEPTIDDRLTKVSDAKLVAFDSKLAAEAQITDAELAACAARGDPRAWSGGKVKPKVTAMARRKRGRKPKHGITMPAWLRKRKERCEERGVPFVIEDHLRARQVKLEQKLKIFTSPTPGKAHVAPPAAKRTRVNPTGCDKGGRKKDDAKSEAA
jgi:hypothetical protein